MLPIHRTSSPSCLLLQKAKTRLALCAKCGTYHTAPSGLSQQAPAASAAAAALAVAVVPAAELLLLAASLHEHPPDAARQVQSCKQNTVLILT